MLDILRNALATEKEALAVMVAKTDDEEIAEKNIELEAEKDAKLDEFKAELVEKKEANVAKKTARIEALESLIADEEAKLAVAENAVAENAVADEVIA